MASKEIDPRASVQLTVQPGEQLTSQLDLNTPPDLPAGYRWTLDGHCALAASQEKVVLYDLEGGGFRYIDDPMPVPPAGWVS